MTSTAWESYWADSRHIGDRGCAPDAGPDFSAALERLWQDFARSLSKEARVLDLATGDGAVLRRLRAARRDLALTGIDQATRLPAKEAGIELRGGISMESLPFPDSRFDAVTSQFGVEYGRTAAIAREVARVLKTRGRLLFVVHHQESPLVSHNAARRDALEWAALGSGFLDKARALARARAVAPLPTPSAFRRAADQARRERAGQSVAEEFLLAIAQTLDLGRSSPPGETLATLDTLERKARDELGRLGALGEAARSAAGIDALRLEIEEAGLSVESVDPFRTFENGPAFAWRVEAVQAGE